VTDTFNRVANVPRASASPTGWALFELSRSREAGSVLWLGRRKRVGSGEGASDLRYDILEPARTTANLFAESRMLASRGLHRFRGFVREICVIRG
jgi:hypothetical protein